MCKQGKGHFRGADGPTIFYEAASQEHAAVNAIESHHCLEEMFKVEGVDFMRAAFDAELLSIAKFRGNLSSKQQDMPAAAMCLSSHGKNVNC